MAEIMKSWLWAELVRFCKFLGSMLFGFVMAVILFLIITLAVDGYMVLAVFITFVWLYICVRADGGI